MYYRIIWLPIFYFPKGSKDIKYCFVICVVTGISFKYYIKLKESKSGNAVANKGSAIMGAASTKSTTTLGEMPPTCRNERWLRRSCCEMGGGPLARLLSFGQGPHIK
jgi:hypothetical protein